MNPSDHAPPDPTGLPATRRVHLVGAAGPIGAACLPALLDAGCVVTARLEPGEPAPDSGGRLIREWRPAAGADDPPEADVVVHAWPVAEGEAPDDALHDLSVRRFETVAGEVARTRARKLVLVSGIEAAGPLDAAGGVAFENAEARPVIHVGGALLAAEKLAYALADRTGVGLVVLRAGHLYGNGQPGFLDRVIAVVSGPDRDLARTEWGNHRFLPLHVKDLAQAVARAVAHGSGTYHVTDGSVPTVGSILRDLDGVARLKGLGFPRIKGPARAAPADGRIHFLYRSDRAMRELGYRPEVTLSAGMAALVDEIALVRRQKDAGLAGFARLAFEDGSSPEASGDVFSEEGRFWDAQDAAESVLYDQPHDWAYDVPVGNVLQLPVYRFLARVLKDAGVRTILDVGCGSGVYSRWLAKEGGVRGLGMDLSRVKIEKAVKLAAEAGVSHLVEYRVANVLDFAAPEKVDAVCAFGALHHFPELEKHLPGILERNLKPGGLLVAVEPHAERGYHPALMRFLRWAMTTPLRDCFDVARYERVSGDAAQGATLRGESPAGLHFHRESFDLDRYLTTAFVPVRTAYTHFLSPFLANAFVVYQKSRRIRKVARLLMPAVVRLDGWFCRFEPLRAWSALGMYAVRVPAPGPGRRL